MNHAARTGYPTAQVRIVLDAFAEKNDLGQSARRDG
jgi:hypothetical protein